MTWSVRVFDHGQDTPIFVDLLDAFDDVVICVGSIAAAFGEREYRLTFDVPESAKREEIDRLGQYGAVFVAPADRAEA